MRKILNSMMLGLSAVLALVGCGGGVSNDDHSSVVIDSTVDYPDAITEWRDNDIQVMTDLLGRVIPVAPLSSNYVGTTFEHETFRTMIYLYDTTIEDRGEAYGEILEANGYTFYGENEMSNYNTYSYAYLIAHDGVRDFVSIQYFYYPGNATTTPRFIIYAWFEDGGDIYTEWPEEALAETLDTTETVPSFVADRYHFRYLLTRGCYVIYGYTSDGTVEETYTSTLENAGWTIDASLYDEGYGIYGESPAGEITLQYLHYDNPENDEGDRMILYIYLNDVEEDTPSE